jgi:NAD(P)-dependent dehydrogenase (short-subunit alcohol dehydrogenase family)
MNAKIAVVTGGSSGIGFETAKALSIKGYELWIVGRDEQKCREACNQITAASSRRASYVLADLSSQQSIRNMAEQLLEKLDRIDVLVNNAGQVLGDFQWSVDHIEMQFATNHLAPFLLTGLLLPLLKKAEAARIVNVSSDSHLSGKINKEDLNFEHNYGWLKAYGQSKLSNILFTYYLAEKLAHLGITVNCLHPGLVRTHIGNKSSTWWTSMGWTIWSMFGISVEAGARTSVYLASSPEVQGLSGKYFVRCKETKSAEIAYDKQLQEWLWQKSEALTSMNYSF